MHPVFFLHEQVNAGATVLSRAHLFFSTHWKNVANSL